MRDFWRFAIRRQFHAAIDMLANAIEACPDSVWSGQPPRAFWYLAFERNFFLRARGATILREPSAENFEAIACSGLQLKNGDRN